MSSQPKLAEKDYVYYGFNGKRVTGDQAKIMIEKSKTAREKFDEEQEVKRSIEYLGAQKQSWINLLILKYEKDPDSFTERDHEKVAELGIDLTKKRG